METKVVHVKDGFDVYIGRTFGRFKDIGWGNPYVIGKHGTREECIAKYKTYVMSNPKLLARLHELKGKRLGCWCKKVDEDVPCHGDILVELVEKL